MSSSTDTIGCFATNSTDADLVLSVMAGQDRRDMTTYESNYRFDTKLTNKPKVAVVKQFVGDGVDPEVLTRTKRAIEKLASAGYEVNEIDLLELKYALAIYYIVVSAEVASNLGRYDGVRYGFSDQSAQDLAQVYKLSRSRGFNAENKRRIMIGNYVLASGYYDAYYLKAQKVRTLLIKALKDAFVKYDFLIGAVAPTPAFKFGAHVDDPLTMYMQDVMTTPANLTGVPAISLPNGTTTDGLPVGLQILASTDSDAKLLAFAKQIEPILEEK